jgi:hypothetical protein
MSNSSTIEVWEQEKVEAMVKKGKLRKVSHASPSMEPLVAFANVI